MNKELDDAEACVFGLREKFYKPNNIDNMVQLTDNMIKNAFDELATTPTT